MFLQQLDAIRQFGKKNQTDDRHLANKNFQTVDCYITKSLKIFKIFFEKLNQENDSEYENQPITPIATFRIRKGSIVSDLKKDEINLKTGLDGW